jgi:hypothetical protein
MTPNAADTAEQEITQRAAVLADALRKLPSDALTLSILFELAVSATIAVTFEPSVARLLCETKCREYECRLGAVARHARMNH